MSRTGTNGRAAGNTAPILAGCDVLPAMNSTNPATGDSAPLVSNAKSGAPVSKGKPNAGGVAGRFTTINTFADFALRSLSRGEIAVWLLLWRDTKRNGLVRTSQADLARRAGCDVATVKRAVARLLRRGLLVLVRRGGLRQGPSTYRVRPLPYD
ncbi:MAG: helix-turn-helix domain-containing protein [Pirellulales bacterium]